MSNSTRTQYTSHYKSYREFAHSFNLEPFPLTEEALVLFATYLSSTGQSHQQINLHLVALRFFSQALGYPSIFDKSPRLARLIRGIKRYQGNRHTRPRRTPVTPFLLRKLGVNLFRSPMLHKDKLMIWAAMLSAFFGFLRVSEYTSQWTGRYDPQITLCVEDIHIFGNRVEIKLKASKTDPFRQGVTVRVAHNGSSLCPVTAIQRYREANPTLVGPLFQFQDGRYLTRQSLMRVLNTIKPAGVANMSTHSFRIGAATAAAAAGYPRWAIQALGRWASDCYRRYVRLSDQTINCVSRAMAYLPGQTFVPYDPDNL